MLPTVAKRARLSARFDFTDPEFLEDEVASFDSRPPDPSLPGPSIIPGSVRSYQQQAQSQFLNPFMDIEAARKALPFLHDQPDDYLRSQSYGDLVEANVAFAKAEHASALTALDRRLAANLREMKAKPTKIEAGFDDGLTQLHMCRFIPGPACLLNKLWQRAQDLIPEGGHKPIANYDLESIGQGANASSRGLAELHNPGLPHLSIKYFLASNITLSEKAISQAKHSEMTLLSVEDQLAEPTNITELRNTLFTASEAQHIISNWNFSISAILGFMFNSNFCAAQLSNRPDRLPILRKFIDRCFAVNASHYRSGRDFLTSVEVGNLWQTWSMQLQPASANQPSRGQSQNQPAASKNQPESKQGSNPFRNICRRFNSPAGCPTPGPSCKVGSGSNQFQLQHLCLEPTGPNICCLQPHSKQDHNRVNVQ